MKHIITKAINYRFILVMCLSLWLIDRFVMSHMVCFGGIQWYFLGGNTSVLVRKCTVLVGPGMIDLWTSYPYIIGCTQRADHTIEQFIINVQDYTVATFMRNNEFLDALVQRGVKWPIPKFVSPYVNFLDLTYGEKMQENRDSVVKNFKPKK